jgi:hypothetical protein
VDEIVRYSPKRIDVINQKSGTFETVELSRLLHEYGHEFPMTNRLLSTLKDDQLRPLRSLVTDFSREKFVVTFDGLISQTQYIRQIHWILTELQQVFDHFVDIEFACDGEDLYLLQCRSQSYSIDSKPDAIPPNIPKDRIIFTANRYVANGNVPEISHIVYVDPQQYGEVIDQQRLLSIGRAVSVLNKILPRRGFILMGPGRWGSRGDIRLGVSVTYSDINNTSMLIEIAGGQTDFVPEPSFGTHFFQDLVEASIRYLPLYPDDPNTIFNDAFFDQAKNILPKIAPEFADLSDVIKVIDVAQDSGGCVLQVLMSADEEQALAYLKAAKS